MTTRKLLFCSIGLLAVGAACLAFAPLVPASIRHALLAQVWPAHKADFPDGDSHWSHGEQPPFAAFESDETDDTEELSDRDKASETTARRLPDDLQPAALAVTRRHKLLITLNALRVRLQI